MKTLVLSVVVLAVGAGCAGPRPSQAPTSVPDLSRSVELVSLTNPVANHADASLTIRTAPRASCFVKVFYSAAPATADGLEDGYTDDNGMVTWTWTVDASATPGSHRIEVICSTGNLETQFETTD